MKSLLIKWLSEPHSLASSVLCDVSGYFFASKFNSVDLDAFPVPAQCMAWIGILFAVVRLVSFILKTRNALRKEEIEIKTQNLEFLKKENDFLGTD